MCLVTMVIYRYALSEVAYVQVACLRVYDSALRSGLRTILFRTT